MLRKLLVIFSFLVVVATGFFVVTRFDTFAISSDIVVPDEEVTSTAKIVIVPDITPESTLESTPESTPQQTDKIDDTPTEPPTNSPTILPAKTPKNDATLKPTNSPIIEITPKATKESTEAPTLAVTQTPDAHTPKPTENEVVTDPTVAPVTKLTTAPTTSPTTAPTIAPVINTDVDASGISAASATNGYITAAILTDEEGMYLLFLNGDRVEIGSLTNDGMWNKIPLVHGDGTYKIIIGEYIDGYFYQKAETTVTYSEVDPYAVYLQSTSAIPFSNGDAYVQKARDLTSGLTTNDDKAYAIYQWVIANITYNNDLIGTAGRNPSITYNNRNGICLDFAELYAAMCRSVGVACAVTTGYYEDVNGYHAWNQFRNNSDKWSTVDTASDSQYRATSMPYSFKKDPALFERVSRY